MEYPEISPKNLREVIEGLARLGTYNVWFSSLMPIRLIASTWLNPIKMGDYLSIDSGNRV